MATMPELKPRSTSKAVVDEHLDALNRGDWNRLMAQGECICDARWTVGGTGQHF